MLWGYEVKEACRGVSGMAVRVRLAPSHGRSAPAVTRQAHDLEDDGSTPSARIMSDVENLDEIVKHLRETIEMARQAANEAGENPRSPLKPFFSDIHTSIWVLFDWVTLRRDIYKL